MQRPRGRIAQLNSLDRGVFAPHQSHEKWLDSNAARGFLSGGKQGSPAVDDARSLNSDVPRSHRNNQSLSTRLTNRVLESINGSVVCLVQRTEQDGIVVQH